MSFFTLLEKKGNFGVFEEFFGDFDDCTDFIPYLGCTVEVTDEVGVTHLLQADVAAPPH